MNNRSPRLFPRIIVRNLQPPNVAVPPIPNTDASSELQLLRTWVEYDPELIDDTLRHPFNRWTILGITIVIATSGAFWTGVGLLINYLVK